MQLAFVNKAGWLLKRGKLQRKWVKRWFSVNSHKGSFRYCNLPGSVSPFSKQMLTERSIRLPEPALRFAFSQTVSLHAFLWGLMANLLDSKLPEIQCWITGSSWSMHLPPAFCCRPWTVASMYFQDALWVHPALTSHASATTNT